jgi:hypothetical protein
MGDVCLEILTAGRSNLTAVRDTVLITYMSG